MARRTFGSFSPNIVNSSGIFNPVCGSELSETVWPIDGEAPAMVSAANNVALVLNLRIFMLNKFISCFFSTTKSNVHAANNKYLLNPI
ncbi:hypothetical protein [Parasphingorhabdus sp.]|uniref:hypothetical protein n=1 Tax=Parasphingorhabdus sp. TaxID=2709688 RepID=UPI003263CAC9